MPGIDLTLKKGADGVYALPEPKRAGRHDGDYVDRKGRPIYVGVDIGADDRTGFSFQQQQPDGSWQNIGRPGFLRQAMDEAQAINTAAIRKAFDEAVRKATRG